MPEGRLGEEPDLADLKRRLPSIALDFLPALRTEVLILAIPTGAITNTYISDR